MVCKCWCFVLLLKSSSSPSSSSSSWSSLMWSLPLKFTMVWSKWSKREGYQVSSSCCSCLWTPLFFLVLESYGVIMVIDREIGDLILSFVLSMWNQMLGLLSPFLLSTCGKFPALVCCMTANGSCWNDSKELESCTATSGSFWNDGKELECCTATNGSFWNDSKELESCTTTSGSFWNDSKELECLHHHHHHHLLLLLLVLGKTPRLHLRLLFYSQWSLWTYDADDDDDVCMSLSPHSESTVL